MIGQNCLGRSSPEIDRVRDCKRVPSPPARITAQRSLVLLSLVSPGLHRLSLTSCSQEKIVIVALLIRSQFVCLNMSRRKREFLSPEEEKFGELLISADGYSLHFRSVLAALLHELGNHPCPSGLVAGADA